MVLRFDIEFVQKFEISGSNNHTFMFLYHENAIPRVKFWFFSKLKNCSKIRNQLPRKPYKPVYLAKCLKKIISPLHWWNSEIKWKFEIGDQHQNHWWISLYPQFIKTFINQFTTHHKMRTSFTKYSNLTSKWTTQSIIHNNPTALPLEKNSKHPPPSHSIKNIPISTPSRDNDSQHSFKTLQTANSHQTILPLQSRTKISISPTSIMNYSTRAAVWFRKNITHRRSFTYRHRNVFETAIRLTFLAIVKIAPTNSPQRKIFSQ